MRLPTAGVVDRDGFLAVGALVGALGWSTTVAVSLFPWLASRPTVAVLVVWAVLVALMAAVGAFATPDAVRFSRPLVAFGVANGLAALATTLAFLDYLPDATYAVAWGLAGAVGYGVAARTVPGPDARVYGVAAVLDLLAVGAVAVLPGWLALALVGVCHVAPLAAVASRTTWGSTLVVAAYGSVFLVGLTYAFTFAPV